MLETGGVVGHDVLRSREVLSLVAVAVEPLVVTSDLAQVGRRARRGHGLFAGSGDRRGVVAEVVQGRVTDVVAVRHDVELREKRGLLQVAVGDVAVRVVGGDEGPLDFGRESQAPVVTGAGVVKVDSAHTGACRIGGAEQEWQFGHQFGEVGGASAKAGRKAPEGVEVAADVGVESDAIVPRLVLRPLQGAEESGRSGDGEGDKAELAEDAAPLLAAHATGITQVGEHLVKGFLAVRGQFDRLAHRVDDPAEDELSGSPASVSRQELLQ